MDRQLKRQLAHIYDLYAFERERHETQAWKLAERARILEMLHKEGKRNLLEIGAGTGRDSLYFRERGLQVTTTDLSWEMARLCRAKGLPVAVTSFDQLAFPPGTFEAVWALNCLLHVPKRELPTVLEEIRSILKPGGLLYMGVYGGPDEEGIWKKDSYSPKRFFALYPDEQLRQVVSRHFSLLDFKTIPVPRGETHYQGMILRKLS
jgi:SAM-dependent methyltransferase